MNEELQSKLADVLGGISEAVVQTKDFAVEQLPDVAMQYVYFGLAWHGFSVAALLLFVVAVVVGWVKFLKWAKQVDEQGLRNGWTEIGEMAVVPLLLLTGLTSIPALIMFTHQAYYLLMALFAPKIYLIQGIAELLK